MGLAAKLFKSVTVVVLKKTHPEPFQWSDLCAKQKLMCFSVELVALFRCLGTIIFSLKLRSLKLTQGLKNWHGLSKAPKSPSWSNGCGKNCCKMAKICHRPGQVVVIAKNEVVKQTTHQPGGPTDGFGCFPAWANVRTCLCYTYALYAYCNGEGGVAPVWYVRQPGRVSIKVIILWLVVGLP